MSRKLHRLIIILAAAMIVFACGVFVNADTGTMTSSKAIGKESHIYYGSYPQTEIVDKASNSGAYLKPWHESSDYEVDESLYSQLKEAAWDNNGDVIIGGEKYHRLKKSEVTYSSEESSSNDYFDWGKNKEKYFRYDPIKWRVFDINGNSAFLIADIVLDNQIYNTSSDDVTWETATIRTWLNSAFINQAFSNEERSQIEDTSLSNVGGNDTVDKVFLLSEEDVYGAKAEEFGFYDETRSSKSSTYAKAVGTSGNSDSMNLGRCCWWLRTLGRDSGKIMYVYDGGGVNTNGWDANDAFDSSIRPAMCINTEAFNNISDVIDYKDVMLSPSPYLYVGKECKPTVTIEGLTEGTDFNVSYSNSNAIGEATVTITGIGKYSGKIKKNYDIVEKLDIRTKVVELSSYQYCYDGTEKKPEVTIEGLTEEVDYTVEYTNNKSIGNATVTITGQGDWKGTLRERFSIVNPSTNDVMMTTITFGTYPQTEIIDKASNSGAYMKPWHEDSDYEVDESLYNQLQDANWDNNNDVEIGGVKYHRLEKSKVTFESESESDGRFSWGDNTEKYFRYEPIKWRAIQVNGDSTFLFADIALDNQQYNNSLEDVTWETSTIRTWLNSTFINQAFSNEERSQIEDTSLTNIGGNDTVDKVFLLSEDDVNGAKAEEYGIDNETRRSKSSTYAKAMGALGNSSRWQLGYCSWCLRTPGRDSSKVMYVYDGGEVNSEGWGVNGTFNSSIRPAVRIRTTANVIDGKSVELSTLKCLYDGKKCEPTVTIDGLTAGVDYEVVYENNINIGAATVTITGIGNYIGTIKRNFVIVDDKDISSYEVELSSRTCRYYNEPCEPIVTIEGLTEGTDFKVEYSNNNAIGEATVTITGIGKYTGSVTEGFTIEDGGFGLSISFENEYLIAAGKLERLTCNIENKTIDKSDVTYQWYVADTMDEEPQKIEGANQSYYDATTTTDRKYYYCYVTYKGETEHCYTSNIGYFDSGKNYYPGCAIDTDKVFLERVSLVVNESGRYRFSTPKDVYINFRDPISKKFLGGDFEEDDKYFAKDLEGGKTYDIIIFNYSNDTATICNVSQDCNHSYGSTSGCCNNCGKSVCGGTNTKHSWNEGKVTKEPTETTAGEKTYKCTRCNETKTETIAALGTAKNVVKDLADNLQNLDTPEKKADAIAGFQTTIADNLSGIAYSLEEGVSGTVAEQMADIEKVVGTATVDAEDSGLSNVSIIGGGLNKTSSGETPKLTIEAVEDTTEIVASLPENVDPNNVTVISMNLENAAKDKDGNLAVPVLITFSVPSGIDADKFVVVHMSSRGIELLTPTLSEDKTTASIVVTHFSDFVLTETTEHRHNLVKVDAKAATCTTNGNTAYWYCDGEDCGKYFSDAKGENEIAKDSWVIKASHKYQHYERGGGYMSNGEAYDRCSVCGNTINYRVLEGYSTSYVKGFKVSKGKGKFTAKWKKQNKKTQKLFSGYQVRWSTDPGMSGAGYRNVGRGKASVSIKGAKKTRYYVQVRTYTGGYYSPWSATKSVVTK